MAEALKFLHASDFHLDEAISGLCELPNHLRARLTNAPYDAARRVFDLAISERVDFVLLSGNLLDLTICGSRPVAFLLSQFELLAQKHIEVYWCSGQIDPIDRWPSSVELPENVRTFSSSVLEDITHRRNGVAIANIYGIGISHNRQAVQDYRADSDDAFSILIGHGEFDSNIMPFDEFRYWALGGSRKANKLERPNSIVSYCGAAQGRHANDAGPHYCNLCRVDSAGKIRVQPVDTDTVRWLPQRISIAESVSQNELKESLGERALKIMVDLPDRLALVHWHLLPSGDFNPQFRNRESVAAVLDWLRNEFGRGELGIWSTDLTIEPPANLPTSWYEEDTILGEYLRAVGRYQSDETLNISLHEYLPVADENHLLAGVARVAGERRGEVLRQVAMMGVEYLAGDQEPAARHQSVVLD